MQNIYIVKKCIDELFFHVVENAFMREVERSLPQFALNNFRGSLSQIDRYGIQHTSRQSNNKLDQIRDKQRLKVDNFAPSNCKTISKGQKHLRNADRSKGNSKHTKSLSIRSDMISSGRDLTSRNQTISVKQKSQRIAKTENSLIKIDGNNETAQFQKEEQLRQQLRANRQKQVLINSLEFKHQRKAGQVKKIGATKIDDLKTFTFSYEGCLIKSKVAKVKIQTNDGQSSKQKETSEEILELSSRVDKAQVFNKKIKLDRNRILPQILYNSASSKNVKETSLKAKGHHREIIFNQKRSNSLIEQMKVQKGIERGIVLNKQINEGLQKLKKDSVSITKSLIDLNRSQFERTLKSKKFVPIFKRSSRSMAKTQT